MTLGWNEISAILGPILLTQASERDLKAKLDEAFGDRLNDRWGTHIYNRACVTKNSNV